MSTILASNDTAAATPGPSAPPSVAGAALGQAVALDAGIGAAIMFLFLVLRRPLPHLLAPRWLSAHSKPPVDPTRLHWARTRRAHEITCNAASATDVSAAVAQDVDTGATNEKSSLNTGSSGRSEGSAAGSSHSTGGSRNSTALEHALDYADPLRDQTATLALLRPPAHNFFGLIWQVAVYPESEVLAACGMDAYVLLQVCKMGLVYFTLTVSLLSCAVLLPINMMAYRLSPPGSPPPSGSTDGQLESDLDELSIAMVPQGSPWLWAHALSVYVFSGALALMIDRLYRRLLPVRFAFLSWPHPARYSVLLLDLPPYVVDDASLRAFVDKLYPDQAESVCLVTRSGPLAKAVNAHDATVRALEYAASQAKKAKGDGKRRRLQDTCDNSNHTAADAQRPALLRSPSRSALRSTFHALATPFRAIGRKRDVPSTVHNNMPEAFPVGPAQRHLSSNGDTAQALASFGGASDAGSATPMISYPSDGLIGGNTLSSGSMLIDVIGQQFNSRAAFNLDSSSDGKSISASSLAQPLVATHEPVTPAGLSFREPSSSTSSSSSRSGAASTTSQLLRPHPTRSEKLKIKHLLLAGDEEVIAYYRHKLARQEAKLFNLRCFGTKHTPDVPPHLMREAMEWVEQQQQAQLQRSRAEMRERLRRPSAFPATGATAPRVSPPQAAGTGPAARLQKPSLSDSSRGRSGNDGLAIYADGSGASLDDGGKQQPIDLAPAATTTITRQLGRATAPMPSLGHSAPIPSDSERASALVAVVLEMEGEGDRTDGKANTEASAASQQMVPASHRSAATTTSRRKRSLPLGPFFLPFRSRRRREAEAFCSLATHVLREHRANEAAMQAFAASLALAVMTSAQGPAKPLLPAAHASAVHARALRRGVYQPSSAGFVTFKSLATAQVAPQVQNVIARGLRAFSVRPAPEPRDVLWEQVAMPRALRFAARRTALGISLALTLGYTVIVSLLASLTNVNSLAKMFPALSGWLEANPGWRALVEGWLASLTLQLVLLAVPVVIRLLVSRYARTRTDAILDTARLMTVFYWWTTVLVFTLSGTVWQALRDLVDRPVSIVTSLADSLPRLAPFFTAFVALQGLVWLPLTLIGFERMLAYWWGSRRAVTDADRWRLRESAAGELGLSWIVPWLLLIWLTGCIYSSINPIVAPAVAIFMALAYWTFKYTSLYVCFSGCQTGGAFWPLVADRLLAGLLLFQIMMVGVLLLKEAPVAATFIFPAPILTLVYWRWMDQHYHRRWTHLPLEAAVDPTRVMRPALCPLSGRLSHDSVTLHAHRDLRVVAALALLHQRVAERLRRSSVRQRLLSTSDAGSNNYSGSGAPSVLRSVSDATADTAAIAATATTARAWGVTTTCIEQEEGAGPTGGAVSGVHLNAGGSSGAQLHRAQAGVESSSSSSGDGDGDGLEMTQLTNHPRTPTQADSGSALQSLATPGFRAQNRHHAVNDNQHPEQTHQQPQRQHQLDCFAVACSRSAMGSVYLRPCFRPELDRVL